MPFITFLLALCVADHIETWPREFSSIWKRKLTGTSVLFLVNRYMLLLSVIIQAIFEFPGNGTDEQCQALNIIYSIFTILSIVAANVLFALRVYAIYNRNRVIFGIASAFIISRLTLDIWNLALGVGGSTIGSPFQNLSRCGLSGNNVDQYTQLLIFLVDLAIPLLALGYDIFTFILTAIKTVQHSLEMQRLNQSSITQIIFRDGTLYFLILRLMLVVAIILAIFSVVNVNQSFIGDYILSNSFPRLPNILISRLMLNLRTYSEPGNTTISQGQQTRVSSLNFASNQMLGNIGAPLDGESFNEEEEEEEEEERVEIEAIGGQHDRSGEPER
ncbi:uncharacterized protein C8R40DRAFT_1211764 [Lentinula edodes]|uniref:uncharacterized protein n=1 Tax=Lentinula edodes TaxID=5353 RepID=UPI001E8EB4FA|nr:uncharacterized protein C8R40DRAFT_1211764 [Lentinula edodes]KAH7870598.1 hypothetical protein C8R40DRAFT_1211764 [Lentinula edodes]